MRIPRFLIFSTLLLSSAFADWQDDIGYTQLAAELGPVLPNGSGVNVRQYEAGGVDANNVPSYLPQAGSGTFAGSGTSYSGKTFTAATTGTYSSHADNVAQLFFGNGVSMTSGITSITCVYAGNFGYSTATNYSGEVHNHSWVADTAQANNLLISYDRAIYERDFLGVSGVFNGTWNASNTQPELMVSSYNGITVGLTNGSHSVGLTPSTVSGGGRVKPEIVAPFALTSFATPVVASAGALLLAHARDEGLTNGTEAEVIKAVLLAGATKSKFPAWTRTQTRPLDTVFGAGEVNVHQSYQILDAGAQGPGNIDSKGWHYDTDLNANQSETYSFTIPDGLLAERVSIVLTWPREITGFRNTVRLSNLDLSIRDASGTLLDRSESSIDNLEHLFLKDLSPGTYSITVSNISTSRNLDTEFALAWNVDLGLNGPCIEIDYQSTNAVAVLSLSDLASGYEYVVESSSDLDSWTEISRFTATGTTASCSETTSGGPHFYRLGWTVRGQGL